MPLNLTSNGNFVAFSSVLTCFGKLRFFEFFHYKDKVWWDGAERLTGRIGKHLQVHVALQFDSPHWWNRYWSCYISRSSSSYWWIWVGFIWRAGPAWFLDLLVRLPWHFSMILQLDVATGHVTVCLCDFLMPLTLVLNSSGLYQDPIVETSCFDLVSHALGNKWIKCWLWRWPAAWHVGNMPQSKWPTRHVLTKKESCVNMTIGLIAHYEFVSLAFNRYDIYDFIFWGVQFQDSCNWD